MRERSHRKGEEYQKSVKEWLCHASLFGLTARPLGDAYAITHKSAEIGGIAFDFSLALHPAGQDGDPVKILYAECKYRSEETGNINREFDEFLKNVLSAASAATRDECGYCEFIFASNIPPDRWRRFVNNRSGYFADQLGTNLNEHPDSVRDCVLKQTSVLISDQRMLGI